MELYLIRHGQSKWQVGESKSKDSALTQLGHEQSQYLNQYIVNSTSLCSRKSVVYVSPQKRALQTTFGLEEIEFIVDERLKEATFHVAATLPCFQVPYVYERQLSADLSYKAFKKSLKQFLDDAVTKESNYENIFLYTHGGVIKTLLRIIHDNDAICYTVHNCSITKLTWHRSRWHLNFLNDVSFIPKEYIT